MKNSIPKTISVVIILIIVSVGLANEHQNPQQEPSDLPIDNVTGPSMDFLQTQEAYNNVTQDDEEGRLKHKYRRR